MEKYLNEMENELRALLATAIKEEIDDETSLKSIEGQIKIVASGIDLKSELDNLDALASKLGISKEQIDEEKNNLRSQKAKELAVLKERKKELELANSLRNKTRKSEIYTKISAYRNGILAQSRELELQTNAEITRLEQEKRAKLVELEELIEKTQQVLETESKNLNSKGTTNLLQRRLKNLNEQKDTVNDEFEQKIADLKARKEQYNSIMRNAANLLNDQSVFEKMKSSEISRLLFKKDRILDKEEKDKDNLTMAFANATGLTIESAEKLLSLIDDQQRKWIEKRYQEFKDMGYQKMEMDLLAADFKDYYENDIPSKIKDQVIKSEPKPKPQPKPKQVISIDLEQLYNRYEEFIIETLISEVKINREEAEKFLDPNNGVHWKAIAKMLVDAPNIDTTSIDEFKMKLREYYIRNNRPQVKNSDDLVQYFTDNKGRIQIAFKVATKIATNQELKTILDSANEEQQKAIAQLHKDCLEGKIDKATMFAKMNDYYCKNLNRDKDEYKNENDVIDAKILELFKEATGLSEEEAKAFLNFPTGEHWNEIKKIYNDASAMPDLVKQNMKKYYDAQQTITKIPPVNKKENDVIDAAIMKCFMEATGLSEEEAKKFLNHPTGEHWKAIKDVYNDTDSPFIRKAQMRAYYDKHKIIEKGTPVYKKENDVIDAAIMKCFMEATGLSEEEAKKFLNHPTGEHWKAIKEKYNDTSATPELVKQKMKEYYDTHKDVTKYSDEDLKKFRRAFWNATVAPEGEMNQIFANPEHLNEIAKIYNMYSSDDERRMEMIQYYEKNIESKTRITVSARGIYINGSGKWPHYFKQMQQQEKFKMEDETEFQSVDDLVTRVINMLAKDYDINKKIFDRNIIAGIMFECLYSFESNPKENYVSQVSFKKHINNYAIMLKTQNKEDKSKGQILYDIQSMSVFNRWKCKRKRTPIFDKEYYDEFKDNAFLAENANIAEVKAGPIQRLLWNITRRGNNKALLEAGDISGNRKGNRKGNSWDLDSETKAFANSRDNSPIGVESRGKDEHDDELDLPF